MRKFISLSLFVIIPLLAQTGPYYKFSDLRGIEDAKGETQLFHTLFYTRPVVVDYLCPFLYI